MKTKKLIVLDVDNTLLHTWHHGDLALALAMARGEDPKFEHDFNAEDYKKQLLSSFSNSYEWLDGIVCPRPHLESFLDYLFKQDIDIGIYSTGVESYLQEVLTKTCPMLLERSLFMWGRTTVNKQRRRNIKDISLVAEHFGYPIGSILMIDDRDNINPWQNLVAIKPFDVDPPYLEDALVDKALLTMKKRLDILFNVSDIHEQRNQEHAEMKLWQKGYADWRWKEKIDLFKDEISDRKYPVPQPKAIDDIDE